MSKLIPAAEAQKITQDKIVKNSTKVFGRITDAINAAADKGKYEASIELDREEEPFAEQVRSTLVEVGYIAEYTKSSLSPRNESIPAKISFNWKPKK